MLEIFFMIVPLRGCFHASLGAGTHQLATGVQGPVWLALPQNRRAMRPVTNAPCALKGLEGKVAASLSQRLSRCPSKALAIVAFR
jgi:hypothetical protein